MLALWSRMTDRMSIEKKGACEEGEPRFELGSL